MANLTISAVSGGSIVKLRTVGNSGDIVVIGDKDASNLTSNTIETVIGATIHKVIYGCPANAYWAVYRGANLAGVYTGSGESSYAITSDPTANITANLTGGTVGFLIMEVSKQSKFN